jgi:hypothetical protein
VVLTVAFDAPPEVGASGVQIPLVGLNPSIGTSSGTLLGGQTIYYAVSALDASGGETALSFTIAARLPAGSDTNTVTLEGLSFSPGTAGMNVYRGNNPAQLLRVAHNAAAASSFLDNGIAPELEGPPDANYDHANFYWRLELQPEVAADIHTVTTIGNTTLGMLPDDFKGTLTRIVSGKGARQERAIVSNDATTLTVAPPWTIVPDSTSQFVVADSTWKFGGLSSISPAQIQVPDQPGATVEVSGRSANALDQESPVELNPFTRWQIGGGNGGGADSDTPPAPIFGLNAAGQGNIELLGIGFTSFANTHTITAGTLSLFTWDELSSPTTFSLASDISATDVTIILNANGSGVVGGLIQIEGEVLAITQIISGGAQYTVSRGSHGSTAAGHLATAPVYHLARNVSIVPFVKGFFGSEASGSYSHQIFLPNVRVAAAELFMTNSIGSGAVAYGAFSGLVDDGIRTLSGGQISIQVEGYLATQTDAAPAFVIEAAHAARDIFAVVTEAPSGGPVVLALRMGSVSYANLTIADGAIVSNTVSGFGLPPLASGDRLALDITAVPSAPGTLPGRDLTVTIRL